MKIAFLSCNTIFAVIEGKEKIDFFNGLNEEEITQVIDRVEETVEEVMPVTE